MADQSVRVTNPPDGGSPARIAMELTRLIAHQERPEKKGDPRAYYLALYRECRDAVY